MRPPNSSVSPARLFSVAPLARGRDGSEGLGVAASVASNLTTTEAAVADAPKKGSGGAPDMGGGMGGMGGMDF